jgi:hypothetical protein
MKVLSSSVGGSHKDKSSLKAFKGSLKSALCVCVSSSSSKHAQRTRSPFDDNDDEEDTWLLGTLPGSINTLPEVRAAQSHPRVGLGTAKQPGREPRGGCSLAWSRRGVSCMPVWLQQQAPVCSSCAGAPAPVSSTVPAVGLTDPDAGAVPCSPCFSL